MIKVSDLSVKIEDKDILKGVDLEVFPNKVHALMGQNGSGKSTLAQVIMGSPFYTVTQGVITFGGKNIIDVSPNERSLEGIFLSFQYPSEVPGVSIQNYLRMIYNKKNSTSLSPAAFRKILAEKMDVLEIKEDFMNRSLNEGFSGGEKKRMEMLQMLLLEPKVVILDEVDSGLDIDAIKIVSKAVNYLKEKSNSSILIITHYTRILNYIEPEFVHIMSDGKIVKEGGKDLAYKLEEHGYNLSEL